MNIIFEPLNKCEDFSGLQNSERFETEALELKMKKQVARLIKLYQMKN